MTGELVFGICFLLAALLMIFWSGKEDSPMIVFFGLVFCLVGAMFIFGDGVRKYKGYASADCGYGTYRLSMADDNNPRVLYITVRDYKDYALRLCSIPRKNVHPGALSRNVQIKIENNEQHLYPAEY